jgi:hypothetical protein
MATKFNVAALGAVLAVLAAPGVVSAQEDFGNYPFAQDVRDASAVPKNRSQSRTNRFVRKAHTALSVRWCRLGDTHSKPTATVAIAAPARRQGFVRAYGADQVPHHPRPRLRCSRPRASIRPDGVDVQLRRGRRAIAARTTSSEADKPDF